jgi:DNA invertase Pin-like site-specific DNA recombinase
MLDIHQIRPQETKVKRVFGYARVSTDSQSVDSQVHAIQQRFPDATVYSDLAVSAFTTPLNKRPAGKALLSQVQAGDMIVAVRPDRLFRSLQDAANQIAEVHRRGAFLMFLDSGSRSDTILGKLLLQVLCMFAELESAETGRSLRHARLAMIASGSDSLDSLLPQPLQQKTSKDKRHACMWRFVPPPDRRGIFNTLLVEMRKGIPFLQASRFAANLWLSQNGLPVIPRRNRVTRKAYLAALKKSPQTLLVKRVIKYLENSPAECVQPPGPSGDICRQNAEKFLRAYHTYKNPEDALIAAIAPDMASAVEAVSNLTN